MFELYLGNMKRVSLARLPKKMPQWWHEL